MGETVRIEKYSTALGEHYVQLRHRSGLDIYVVPKHFSSAYALFGTRYGSLDNRFRTDGDQTYTEVPDGIAHFLEHKMFESPDGEDTFARFARVGANANAYTSFNMTAYLFSATSHVYESLEILLDFVTHPYFTPENVSKEQGIIAQEIRMGEDSPERRVMFDVLAAMYEKHNVRLEIAGTVASIAEIDADMLYKCYHTFYNLHNMALVISGDVTPEGVLAVADRVLQPAAPQSIESVYAEEKPEVFRPSVSRRMQVSKPLFDIGLKITDIPSDPRERMKQSACLSILCDALYGRSSRFFQELYDEGLLSQDFGSWNECNRAFSFILWEGESSDPGEVYRRLRATAEEACRTGVSPEDFERCRRVLYALLVRSFDSTAGIANSFLNYVFDDADIFDYAEVLASLTVGDLDTLLRRLVRPERFAIAIIEPLD